VEVAFREGGGFGVDDYSGCGTGDANERMAAMANNRFRATWWSPKRISRTRSSETNFHIALDSAARSC